MKMGEFGVSGVYPVVKYDDRKELFLHGLLGDKKAKETAIASLYPLAISIALKYDDGRDRVDDVVQDAMMKVVRKFDKYDPNRADAAGPATYFEKVIRNEIKRAYGVFREFAPLPPIDPAAKAEDAWVERDDISVRVQGALQKLPSHRRTLIERIYGMKGPEEAEAAIAEEEGRSRAAVNLQAQKAYAELRSHLRETGDEDEFTKKRKLDAQWSEYVGAHPIKRKRIRCKKSEMAFREQLRLNA